VKVADADISSISRKYAPLRVHAGRWSLLQSFALNFYHDQTTRAPRDRGVPAAHRLLYVRPSRRDHGQTLITTRQSM